MQDEQNSTNNLYFYYFTDPKKGENMTHVYIMYGALFSNKICQVACELTFRHYVHSPRTSVIFSILVRFQCTQTLNAVIVNVIETILCGTLCGANDARHI